jgi:hypothetical protein
MCTAVIQAKFAKNNVKIFDLSGSQAIVLLAFNELKPEDEDCLSIEKLTEITGL